MLTEQEKFLASKLYSMLYKGANIYNAPNKKYKPMPDPVIRFGLIVRELQQHMKEIENG